MTTAIKVVDSFRWPRLADAREVEAINRSLAKGILLFADEAPTVVRKQTLQGEIYKEVSSTGYAAVRMPSMWRQLQRRVFKLGRHPKHRAAYLAACQEAEEEPRTEFYYVDMDNQSCTCQDWANNARWCKHILGLAYHLARPHRFAASGLLILEDVTP